jgi:hypothetical protein
MSIESGREKLVLTPLAPWHLDGDQNVERVAYPRPTKGIFVAITVMKRTLVSSGRLAM